jgi:flagellar M-ring protein FliF
VARSVDGLEVDNIEVTDQNYETIYSGATVDSFVGNDVYDLEQRRKNEIISHIKRAFMPLFDETEVVLHLEIDNDTEHTDSLTLTSPYDAESQTGVIDNETTSRSSATNAAGGEPGLAENDATTPTYQINNAGASNATTDDRATQYLYNTVNQSTEKGVGKIVTANSSISVMFYKYKKHDQKILTDQNALNGMTWEAYKDSVQPVELPVDAGILSALTVGTGVSNVSAKAYEIPVFYDAEEQPVQIQQIVMFAILALLILLLAYGVIRAAQPDEVIDIEPELSVEGLLASTKLEEEKEKEAEAAKLQGIEFEPQSEIMMQIEKFVNERPEAVAQLLRNWLNNEWE